MDTLIVDNRKFPSEMMETPEKNKKPKKSLTGLIGLLVLGLLVLAALIYFLFFKKENLLQEPVPASIQEQRDSIDLIRANTADISNEQRDIEINNFFDLSEYEAQMEMEKAEIQKLEGQNIEINEFSS